MRGQNLTRRIAMGVAIATVCFIALSTALIGGLEWQKLQRRIDETMSFQTRSVLSGLQMLHEAVAVSMQSQLKMLKSFFPYGTRVEIDEKETTEMGPSKMKVPIFRLGGIEMNERFIEVDLLTEQTGSVATIFERIGDDFLRISTSLRKEDGSRAFLTNLDRDHPAYKRLLAGQEYIGPAILFGKDYMTIYEPMKSEDGEVVGAWFIGYPLGSLLAKFRSSVMEMKIGQTGYVYVMDKNGYMRIHPSLEGKNVREMRDATGYDFVGEMLEKKNGVVRYQWIDPGKDKSREKVAAYAYFPEWEWLVVSSAYVDELAEELMGNILRNSLAAIGEAALLALVMIWLVRRALRPLDTFVQVTERMASGDLSQTLHYERSDELGRLATAINHMRSELAGLIGALQREASDVAVRAQTIERQAEEVQQRIAVQADDTQAVAGAMEEFSVALNQLAQHMRETARRAQASMEKSEEGAATIAAAIEGMNQIAQIVETAAERIRTLEGFSQQISTIVATIREIADQTNLLALNAAIEAARAGEQGRGFAVVADEVRKLAERTGNATQEIGDMIAKIQHATSEAVAGMDEGVDEVRRGVEHARQARSAIDEIRQESLETARAVQEVDQALDQQTEAVHTIAQRVERIAGSAEASAAAAKDSEAQAKALQEAASSLRQRADHFKV
ncbi:methyl-accepting chemotaxis protein [Tepidiphilus baoligensis]|uniref:HAMP domain-containing protein n=1 Tax=Tepidiphilus baoligensis TaxID=2698687 RepID=A0ABX1QMM9_9PROT|nr:methyl-accepting chemotaxis protein [Tepidiphilus baoligensis]NMH17180.1 HAMP domain-containing protein [Tepidiphilus baoligensis]